MDLPQTPNMAEPITNPETSVVKQGKLSNYSIFGSKVKTNIF